MAGIKTGGEGHVFTIHRLADSHQLLRAARRLATTGVATFRNGLPMTAAKGSGVISNAFDGANRLVSTRVTGTGPQAYAVSYGLDAAGNPTNTQSSEIGYSVGRTFDAGERVASLAAGSVGGATGSRLHTSQSS